MKTKPEIPSTPKRFILRTITLNEEEAKTRRDLELKEAEMEIRYRLEQMEEATQALNKLRSAPLEFTTTAYESVSPSDPDWEKADFEMNPSLYSGEWKYMVPDETKPPKKT